jgi:hypothetical protein
MPALDGSLIYGGRGIALSWTTGLKEAAQFLMMR